MIVLLELIVARLHIVEVIQVHILGAKLQAVHQAGRPQAVQQLLRLILPLQVQAAAEKVAAGENLAEELLAA